MVTTSNEEVEAAEQVANDFVSTLNDEQQQAVKTGVLLSFVRSAPRKARRAAMFTKDKTVSFTKTVGKGIGALMPVVAVLVGISIIAAAIGATMALGSWALMGAFAIHPLVGWSIVILTALTCMRIAVAVVGNAYRAAFGS